MKRPHDQDALFAAWRRCAQAGLSPDATDKLYPLDGETVQLLCREHLAQIDPFRRLTAGLPLPGDAAAVLMDGRGVILEKKYDRGAVETVSSGLLLCGGMRRGERRLSGAHAA